MINLKIFVDDSRPSPGADTFAILVRRKSLGKVYSTGDALAVNVPRGSGERLEQHLATYGIVSLVRPHDRFDQLVIDGDNFPADVQESVDRWENE